MAGSPIGILLVSILLVLGTAFFVSAEYAIVASRRSRIEAHAKRGHRGAKSALRTMDKASQLIAVSQIGISMIGIGLGSVTEPFLTAWLSKLLGAAVPRALSVALALIVITFFLVVIGELAPKYYTMRRAERMLLATHRPMRFFAQIGSPLIWLMQSTTAILLKPFGIDIHDKADEGIAKEELLVMVRAGSDEGLLDRPHAELVTRALKIDQLVARDIMVHRLDIKWLDISLSREELMEKLKGIPYGRIPVCEGDVDEVLGIAYLHDIVKNMGRSDFSLASILRPAITIPENLAMDRIVAQMRETKTQILIVLDEYGGTSGLITLEDVVEEVFGELEDRLEFERPPIELLPAGRVSARADVRLDELLARLGLEMDIEGATRTLAQVIIDALDRVPKPGDHVETALGLMRVENMARQRITRVSVQLSAEIQRRIQERKDEEAE
jgi:putative hemolysin